MPYFLVDGKSIYDKLHQPKFHLIVFQDGQNDRKAMDGEIQMEFADLVDSAIVQLDPQVAEIFGTANPFSVLLRPENYIGAISSDGSLGPMKNYLERYL